MLSRITSAPLHVKPCLLAPRATFEVSGSASAASSEARIIDYLSSLIPDIFSPFVRQTSCSDEWHFSQDFFFPPPSPLCVAGDGDIFIWSL